MNDNPSTSRKVENDIALLRLNESVSFTYEIQPVCLPPLGADYTGRDALVTGWGALTSGKSRTGTMKIALASYNLTFMKV